jgi:hypothetical protein
VKIVDFEYVVRCRLRFSLDETKHILYHAQQQSFGSVVNLMLRWVTEFAQQGMTHPEDELEFVVTKNDVSNMHSVCPDGHVHKNLARIVSDHGWDIRENLVFWETPSESSISSSSKVRL